MSISEASGPASGTGETTGEELESEYARLTLGNVGNTVWHIPACKSTESQAAPLLKPYLENSKPYIRHGECNVTAYDQHSSCAEIMDDILSFYFPTQSLNHYQNMLEEFTTTDEFKTFEHFLRIIKKFPVPETSNRNAKMVKDEWFEWRDCVNREIEDDAVFRDKTRKSRNVTVLLESYVFAQTTEKGSDAAHDELKSTIRALLDFLCIDYRYNGEVRLSMDCKIKCEEYYNTRSKQVDSQLRYQQTVSFHCKPDVIVISEWCRKVCFAFVIEICSGKLKKKHITLGASNSSESTGSSKDQDDENNSSTSSSSFRPRSGSSHNMRNQGQKSSVQHPLQLLCSAYEIDGLLRKKSLLFKDINMMDALQEGTSTTHSQHLTMPGMLIYKDKVLLTKMVCERYDLSQHEKDAHYRFSKSNQYVINNKCLVIHNHWKQLAQLLALFSRSMPIIDYRIRTTT